MLPPQRINRELRILLEGEKSTDLCVYDSMKLIESVTFEIVGRAVEFYTLSYV